MANITIVPCIKLLSKDFGTNYSNWENLTELGLIAWKSAINYVESSDRTVLLHFDLQVKNHQNMEREIIRECIKLHEQGHNVLLLEADTICVKTVDIFELKLDKLTLFSLAGTEDNPDLPQKFNLNSGVVFLPNTANGAVKILKTYLESEWPAKWAHYQFIWNRAFYSQFETMENGLSYVVDRRPGSYNFFESKTHINCKISDAKILHNFSSRSVGQARFISRLAYSYGVNGYKIGLKLLATKNKVRIKDYVKLFKTFLYKFLKT